MKEIKKMIILDYYSIKPYFTLKNLVILLLLTLIYSFFSKNIMTAFSMPMLFALLFSSYPFLVGDEAGIDILYKFFGIDGHKVVNGRYLLAFILFIGASAIGFLFSLLFVLILKDNSSDSLIGILLSNFIIYSLIICIQYPLYFKYGYARAKTFAMVPFLLFGILGYISYYFKSHIIAIIYFITSHIVVTTLIGILALFTVFRVSLRLSRKWYAVREF